MEADPTKDVIEEAEEGEIAPNEDQGQEGQDQEGEDYVPLSEFRLPEGPLTLEGVDALMAAIQVDTYDIESVVCLKGEAKDRFILGIAAGDYTPEMILQLAQKLRDLGVCRGPYFM